MSEDKNITVKSREIKSRKAGPQDAKSKEVELTSLDYVIRGLKAASIDSYNAETDKLAAYMEGILEWNEKINLTAIIEPAEFVEKHYIDSLAALKVAEFQDAERIMDLGTGGGFPGVPLAIMRPEKEFILADSIAKRLKIIDKLTMALEISNIETLHGRAEDLAHKEEYRETFDLVVSRAVAEMKVLAEYALPFVKVGGAMIAYKTEGEKLDEEITAAERAIKVLGGRPSRTKKGAGDHVLVIIEKVKKTPPKYPRKAGTPRKEPL
ncbi:MAG: 16S rRNA (guanine(527)-N(7))-methyltransferase RsmG [Firmicutes bacterium]|nr:16S rRNA (guanine(527)-N(7))-methyltransferase RsmG [Bacillota bacterium]